MHSLDIWLKKFETFKPFTQDEAWALFRLAAISEACGWSLLILGILTKRYIVHGNDIPVLISGRIHGAIFIVYLTASVLLYPSLAWSRKRAIIAIMASVPPFGSLLFEQWAARRRHLAQIKSYGRFVAYLSVLKRSQQNSA